MTQRYITWVVSIRAPLAGCDAAATGLRYDDVLSLSGTDFTAALLKTQSFFDRNGRPTGDSLRLSILRMVKYSKTPMAFFLALPLGELGEWMEIFNEEMKREEKETKAASEHKK